MEQDYEAWAVNIAHQIVMREGFDLAVAAQNLDKKGTQQNRYKLMDAITHSLLEARAMASKLPH